MLRIAFSINFSRRAQNGRRGFTLLEVMIAGGLMCLIFVAAGGVYYFAVSQFKRGAANLQTLQEASLGLDMMTETVNDGLRAYSLSRSALSPALAVVVPLDKSPDGTYKPYRSGSTVLYRDGVTYFFYTSNKTGSLSQAGDILWRASLLPAAFLKVPDTQWSLIPGTTKGKTSGVTSFTFTIDSVNNRVDVTLTLSDQTGSSTRTLTRSASLGNHN